MLARGGELEDSPRHHFGRLVGLVVQSKLLARGFECRVYLADGLRIEGVTINEGSQRHQSLHSQSRGRDAPPLPARSPRRHPNGQEPDRVVSIDTLRENSSIRRKGGRNKEGATLSS